MSNNESNNKQGSDNWLNVVIVLLSISILIMVGFFYIGFVKKPGVVDKEADAQTQVGNFQDIIQKYLPSKVKRAHKRCVKRLTRKSLSMSGGLSRIPAEQRKFIEERVRSEMENTCTVVLFECYSDPKSDKCKKSMKNAELLPLI